MNKKYLFSRLGSRVWYHYKNTVSRIQVYFINFIILRGTFHPLLSSAIMQLFKKPETLDFTEKIYKKAFVSVYHILSFARGVKISLWGKDWGKLWGMRTI